MRSYIVFSCTLLIFAYFGYHFILTHSTEAPSILERTYTEHKKTLQNLDKEEALWKNKIRALQEHSFDPDLIEESVRYLLNKGRAHEEVILVA